MSSVNKCRYFIFNGERKHITIANHLVFIFLFGALVFLVQIILIILANTEHRAPHIETGAIMQNMLLLLLVLRMLQTLALIQTTTNWKLCSTESITRRSCFIIFTNHFCTFKTFCCLFLLQCCCMFHACIREFFLCLWILYSISH